MNEKLKKILAAKEAARAAALERSKKSEDVAELRAINAELDQLNAEILEIRGLIDLAQEPAADPVAADPVATPDAGKETARQVMGTYTGEARGGNRDEVRAILEKRGEDLRAKAAIQVALEEARDITVASSNLVVEKKYSQTANPGFNEISSLYQGVNSVPLNGGESYTKAFVVSIGEGDYTNEGAEYHEAEPKFDYVDIAKTKITAYAEITEEAKKLPNVDYQGMVVDAVRGAIQKKISRQILVGAGGSGVIRGILNSEAKVMPTDSDIKIDKIDADTLDKIVLGYGGDEDIEGGAVLIINKKTLVEFAKVKADGKKVYKITIDPSQNTGTISSEDSWKVPFILNSAVKGFADTTNDQFFGAYGKLKAYELPVFSPLEVRESTDYKFKSGQIAYRGSIFVGGGVAAYKGFAKLQKVATA